MKGLIDTLHMFSGQEKTPVSELPGLWNAHGVTEYNKNSGATNIKYMPDTIKDTAEDMYHRKGDPSTNLDFARGVVAHEFGHDRQFKELPNLSLNPDDLSLSESRDLHFGGRSKDARLADYSFKNYKDEFNAEMFGQAVKFLNSHDRAKNSDGIRLNMIDLHKLTDSMPGLTDAVKKLLKTPVYASHPLKDRI